MVLSVPSLEICKSNKFRRIWVNVWLSHRRPRLKHYVEQEDTQTSVKLLRKMQSQSVTAGMPALYELCSIDKALHVMLGRGDSRSSPIQLKPTSPGARQRRSSLQNLEVASLPKVVGVPGTWG